MRVFLVTLLAAGAALLVTVAAMATTQTAQLFHDVGLSARS